MLVLATTLQEQLEKGFILNFEQGSTVSNGRLQLDSLDDIKIQIDVD